MGPQHSPCRALIPGRKSNISRGTAYALCKAPWGRHKHSLLELSCPTPAATGPWDRTGLRPPAPPEGARPNDQVRRNGGPPRNPWEILKTRPCFLTATGQGPNALWELPGPPSAAPAEWASSRRLQAWGGLSQRAT